VFFIKTPWETSTGGGLLKATSSRMFQMAWNILETKAASADANMRLDEKLLQDLADHDKPILHLYEWEKESATFGYFMKPEELLNLEEAKKRGLDIARRPTGGGVVFHLWDLAFSVLVPVKSPLFSTNTLDNYNLVNQVVKEVVKEFIGREELSITPDDGPFQDFNCTHFCMARPTKYDVMLSGKKIAGAAQRKTKGGFLHQGTIALLRPDEELLAAVLPSAAVREAMKQITFPLMSQQNLRKGRNELCELLKRHFIQL
jgi:lipoate-protein ligase A